MDGFNRSSKYDVLWPLVVGAFSLHLLAPLIFREQYFLMLMLDDAADLLSALAIFSAVPLRKIKLKLLSLAYAMFSFFVFANNLAIEMAIQNIRAWQLVCIAACICMGSFVGGWTMGLYRMERDY